MIELELKPLEFPAATSEVIGVEELTLDDLHDLVMDGVVSYEQYRLLVAAM